MFNDIGDIDNLNTETRNAQFERELNESLDALQEWWNAKGKPTMQRAGKFFEPRTPYGSGPDMISNEFAGDIKVSGTYAKLLGTDEAASGIKGLLQKVGSVTEALMASPEMRVAGNPIVGLALAKLQYDRDNNPNLNGMTAEQKKAYVAKYMQDMEAMAVRRLEQRSKSSDPSTWGQSITKEDVFWEMKNLAQEHDDVEWNQNWKARYREPAKAIEEKPGMYFKNNGEFSPFGEPNI